MPGGIQFLPGDDITEALAQRHRVYLCGDLEFPQTGLPCLPDDKLEIGVSHYKTFQADTPHVHPRDMEYNYVLRGKVKIYLLDEKREYEFTEGSLFVIAPNTPYASKGYADTRVLFVKCPGGNDKQCLEADGALADWMRAWA
ncbi:MAG: cupin domain-containing protein [Oscillospiraceae bacterium]|jgi:quercetin dioxygenase-like cupin family protein|nr:cupin domain-containing protein [Oscillospiraceae bacterium]